MSPYRSYFWRKTPFLKLLLPFVAGIILQWQFELPVLSLWICWAAGFILFIIIFFLPIFRRFKWSFLTGLAAILIFGSTGAIITWHKNIRHDRDWFGKQYKEDDALLVSLNEPLSEKNKSFKANAHVSALLNGDSSRPVTGTIILYFQKSSDSVSNNNSLQELGYGTRLIIKKPLQEIKNSGNPGGFDYKRYSLFQGITHQVFLKETDYEILPGKEKTWLNEFLYLSREKILHSLRKNIKGEKELGLAEALLIGYKDDLEQSLVQSYTNTGVVHIIAISGLHLGLVYWLLLLLFKPLKRSRKSKWLVPFLVILGLWTFSLLAGAQASVLRSALMFTCIVLGDSFSRKTSIYNTMAISAFLLLCYDPFWLWDVGFQLSYAAVLSIIIFMQPVYNLFYIKNKLLDFIWKLNAVTIAAQILTVPISIYHFHQFPNYFLLTNFIAVPLSSLIVLGEIFLCAVAFVPVVASFTGQLLTWLIWLMNTYIERIQQLPYSLWDGLQISISQAILMLGFSVGIVYWLMEKSKTSLKWSLIALLVFTSLRTIDVIRADRQQKIIVYNVPQKKAVDLMVGEKYVFTGDSDLQEDGFARNFHLKPSRTLNRTEETDQPDNIFFNENSISLGDKHILMVDHAVSFSKPVEKTNIDLLIISKNPRLFMNDLANGFRIKQVVFDGSVPAWKSKYWKKDCDSLHIPWHDVTTNGAFVMTLN